MVRRRPIVKRFLIGGVTAAAMLSAGQSHRAFAAPGDKLLLQVSPAVGIAPAYVVVRAIVEHNSHNRGLEIVADSEAFYRRTVLDLDGEQAPKVNELQLKDIPGGDYEITATLFDSHGERTTVRRTLMIKSAGMDR